MFIVKGVGTKGGTRHQHMYSQGKAMTAQINTKATRSRGTSRFTDLFTFEMTKSQT